MQAQEKQPPSQPHGQVPKTTMMGERDISFIPITDTWDALHSGEARSPCGDVLELEGAQLVLLGAPIKPRRAKASDHIPK